MAIVIPDEQIRAAMAGSGNRVVIQPHPSKIPLSDQKFDVDVPDGKIRMVAVTQLFWLNMSIPFSTPGVASEQRSGFTDQQNFPLYMRAAWTNMAATDVLVMVKTSTQNLNWSSRPVLIGSIAGRTPLADPMLYYRRGFHLAAQSTIQGDFTNSPTAPEDGTSRVIWLCERPEEQARVPVSRSMDYRLDVSLRLTGGPTGTGQQISVQISDPILIYGAITDADPLTQIRITDTEKNRSWASTLLPIGAFAGIDDGSNVQNIIRYPKPYLLAPNASLQIDWLNAGDDTGKFITFLGERILSQNGALPEQPAPPFEQPTPQQPGPGPVMPAPPNQPGPTIQPSVPFSECQQIWMNSVLGGIDPRFPDRDTQARYLYQCKQRGMIDTQYILKDGRLIHK